MAEQSIIRQAWKEFPGTWFKSTLGIAVGAVMYHLLIAPTLSDAPFGTEFMYRLVHRVYEMPLFALIVSAIVFVGWYVNRSRSASSGRE